MHSERCEAQQSNTAKMVNYQNQIQILEKIIVSERKEREKKHSHKKPDIPENKTKEKKAPKAKLQNVAESKVGSDEISYFVE